MSSNVKLFLSNSNRTKYFVNFFLPLLALLSSFFIVFCFRLLEVPFWDNSLFFFDEQRILATHDAYHWAAGADGFEFGASNPTSLLLDFIRTTTGYSVTNIAFWLPVVLSSLFSVVIFLWCCLYNSPYTGVVAGVIASSAVAVLSRTLLGFYDTDYALLIFPLIISLGLSYWLKAWSVSLNQAVSNIVCLFIGQSYINNKPTIKNHWLFSNILLPFVFIVFGVLAYFFIVEKNSSMPLYVEFLFLFVPLLIFLVFSKLLAFPVAYTLFYFFLPLFGGLVGGGIALVVAIIFYFYKNDDVVCELTKFDEQGFISYAFLVSRVLSFFNVLLLAVLGFFAYIIRDIHSFFPYLSIYYVFFLLLLILFLGKSKHKKVLIQGWIVFSVPLIFGFWGLCFSLFYAFTLRYLSKRTNLDESSKSITSFDSKAIYGGNNIFTSFISKVVWSNLWLILFVFFVCIYCIDKSVFDKMIASFLFYTTRVEVSRDLKLFYPSATISISETQIFPWKKAIESIYTVPFLAMLPMAVFLVGCFIFPFLTWLLPFALLFVASQKMGGRMLMFGVPAFILPYCIFLGLVIEQFFAYLKNYWDNSKNILFKNYNNILLFCLPNSLKINIIKFVFSIIISISVIGSAYFDFYYFSSGPILSKQFATALSFLQNNTPKDSRIWIWWDWGYAAHYYAKRETIADGARHDGATLFLPALVYTTDNPKLARQLIALTSLKNNKAHKVFEDMEPARVNQLIASLGQESTPLIEKKGKQYLVVNFELLKIFGWVSFYGSWDFVAKKSDKKNVYITDSKLKFDSNTGEVIKTDSNSNFMAKTVSVLTLNSIKNYSYNSSKGMHFIITDIEEKNRDPLEIPLITKLWTYILDEKPFVKYYNSSVVLDDSAYNSLGVQLLICPKDDPRFSNYFKLVYDSSVVRIYEII